MENNLNDPKNIAGLSNLLRDDDIDSTMDLAELEREIANGAIMDSRAEVNVADEYRKEMDRLSRNFDIGSTPNPVHTSEIDSPRAISQNSPVHRSEPLSHNTYNSPKANYLHDDFGDTQLNRMTQEERKQDRINKVLHDIDDRELEFNIEKEKDEDDKASLLEQIDMLKITLEDDGVDISGVPQLNKNSSMKDVHNVYKILRLKNDRNRYCSFAEELILSGAYGMEYLFDGKKEWFSKKPDLTGWSSTVKVKLRRMRFETSTFVQEVMQEYNMSAGIRLALELLPSMFLYSRNRRLSQDDNLVSDNDYKNAISKLNSM
jgi:hypothetical protein